MHAQQDIVLCPGAGPATVSLAATSFASHDRSVAITVMIASRRQVSPTWLGLLERADDVQIQREPIRDATQLLACLAQHPPEVLLLDKALLDGLDPQAAHRIHEQCRRVRVLLVSDEIDHRLVADVLRNRFHGVLSTACLPDFCLKAIRAVCNGELWLPRACLAMAVADLLGLSGIAQAQPSSNAPDAPDLLTPRQQQVVALLRRGCINKEIARELGIREDTVKKHLQSVFGKLGVHRRALVALRPLSGAA